MTDGPRPDERARAELAHLLPLRNQLSRRSNVLRRGLADASGSRRRDALLAKARRCERVVSLLDARIRLAAEVIAVGRVSRPNGDAPPPASDPAASPAPAQSVAE